MSQARGADYSAKLREFVTAAYKFMFLRLAQGADTIGARAPLMHA